MPNLHLRSLPGFRNTMLKAFHWSLQRSGVDDCLGLRNRFSGGLLSFSNVHISPVISSQTNHGHIVSFNNTIDLIINIINCVIQSGDYQHIVLAPQAAYMLKVQPQPPRLNLGGLIVRPSHRSLEGCWFNSSLELRNRLPEGMTLTNVPILSVIRDFDFRYVALFFKGEAFPSA